MIGQQRLWLFSRTGILVYVLCALIAACKSTGPATKSPTPAPTQTTTPEKKPEPTVQQPPVKKLVKMRIALVMQYELKENFAKDTVHGGLSELDITPGSMAALHFYEGAKLAADSLLKDSIQITLSGIDAPVDSASAARLFSGYSLRDYDYVIAGIQPALAASAAAAASRSKINLLLMQAPAATVTDSNPNVALAGASTFTQCREMATWIKNTYPASQVTLIYRKMKREHELAGVFKKTIVADGSMPTPIEFDATGAVLADLYPKLSFDKRNVVIVVSSDEAFVKNVVSTINEFGISGIYICGLPTWTGFESIDFMNLENLKVFLFDNNYIDPVDPKVTAFRKLFLSKYAADPLPQAFNGFELVYTLGVNGTGQKGPLCERLSNAFKTSDRFHFSVPPAGSGCENLKINVLTIEEYQLKKAEK